MSEQQTRTRVETSGDDEIKTLMELDEDHFRVIVARVFVDGHGGGGTRGALLDPRNIDRTRRELKRLVAKQQDAMFAKKVEYQGSIVGDPPWKIREKKDNYNLWRAKASRRLEHLIKMKRTVEEVKAKQPEPIRIPGGAYAPRHIAVITDLATAIWKHREISQAQGIKAEAHDIYLWDALSRVQVVVADGTTRLVGEIVENSVAKQRERGEMW